MRLAVISDIHGNLPALEKVLASIKQSGADLICCLGDIVGYGPFPNECIDLIRERCTHVIAGNHEYGVLGLVDLGRFNREGSKAIRWTRNVISDNHADYLRSRPLIDMFSDITLAHASPLRADEWKYLVSKEEARSALAHCPTRICFIGHTHVPAIIGNDGQKTEFGKQGRFLLNVGSVGQPRDGDPRAAFGMMDTAEGWYKLCRVDYPVHQCADAILEAGLPVILARRLFDGV